MLCTEWTLVKHLRRTITVSPLKCKCWTCEICGPMRSRQLSRQAFLGQPTSFLTLTVNPARGEGPDDRAQELAHAWRLLRLRAMRALGLKSMPFLAVFEKTKAGEPHLHILLRTVYIDQGWLSDQMRELTDAPIVDIRAVKDKGMLAAYIAKYVAKDPHRFEGTKRYWSSQDYALPAQEDAQDVAGPPPTFTVSRMSVLSYVSMAISAGFLYEGADEGAYHLNYDWWRSRGKAHGLSDAA